ncbi:ATP-binding protein, partial [Streptomyces sp. SID7909]|nr:ATP-binding protein [Streptomyces sp. SID7909]
GGGKGAARGGPLALIGGARRNLVAAGAGVLLAGVLGTVVTLGLTSNSDPQGGAGTSTEQEAPDDGIYDEEVDTGEPADGPSTTEAPSGSASASASVTPSATGSESAPAGGVTPSATSSAPDTPSSSGSPSSPRATESSHKPPTSSSPTPTKTAGSPTPTDTETESPSPGETDPDQPDPDEPGTKPGTPEQASDSPSGA